MANCAVAASATNLLCSACQRIFSRDPKELFSPGNMTVNPQTHHTDWKSLAKAIGDGCALCKRLALNSTAYAKLAASGGKESDSSGTTYYMQWWKQPLSIEISTGQHLWVADIAVQTFDIEKDPEPQALWSSTGSALTMNMCTSWLRNCQQQHATCGWRSIPTWYPTRLLEIDPHTSKWRVCVPSLDGPPHTRYMSLSHRWTDNPELLLTGGNYDKLREWTALDVLSQTFGDAIQLTLELAMRYIWIDSLCIIQDSHNGEDWRAESQTMQNVYTNAVCNLVAGDCAKTGHINGIFRNRDPAPVESFLVQCSWPSEPAVLQLSLQSIVQEDFHSSPIYKRGWVLQERLLPSRILHFGARQVYWRCSEMVASESTPQGYKATATSGISLHLLKDLAKRRTTQDKAKAEMPSMSDDMLRLWMNIVQEYSSCDLTYNSDRPVALLGIQNVFATMTNEEYDYGLWASAAIKCLCWVPLVAMPGRIDDFPTWSWLSIDQAIHYTWNYFLPHWQDTVQLARAIKPDTGEKESRTEAGLLTLEAVLVPAQCRVGVEAPSADVNSDPASSDDEHAEGPYMAAEGMVRSDVRQIKLGASADAPWRPLSYGGQEYFFDTEPGHTSMTELYMLPLFAHNSNPEGWSEGLITVEGLMLRRKSGLECFARVGYFRHLSDESDGEADVFGVALRSEGNRRVVERDGEGHMMAAENRPLQKVRVV